MRPAQALAIAALALPLSLPVSLPVTLSLSLSPVLPAQQATPAPVLPSDETCAAMLRELDRAFNAGDADGYLRLFAVEQPLLQELHGRAVRARLGGKAPLQRMSAANAAPRLVGGHVVVPVEYQYRCTDRSDLPLLREQGLLVALPQPNRLQPVLAVDLPRANCSSDDVFTCPPCNYRIGGVDGWLCVPIAQDRTAAVEAATFLLLGTDVALEITVQIGDVELRATDVVLQLVAGLRPRASAAPPVPAEPWQPPSVPPGIAGCSAAKATVDLPDNQRAVLYAVVLGRLRHLLLLRGARPALQTRVEAIDALLLSYRLLVTDRSLALQAAASLLAHTGGDLHDGGVYRNDRHGIEAAGPSDWGALRHCGGALFQVVWSCPDGKGRMWLSGFAAPAGFAHWDAESCDRWLDDLVRRAGLLVDAANDSGWGEPQHGVRERRILATAGARAGTAVSTDPPAAVARHLRLLLRDDLLVVADAYTVDPSQERRVLQAMSSVRSTR